MANPHPKTEHLRRGGPGRPKGRKNKVPGSVKASVKEVLTEIASAQTDEIRSAIMKGLNSRPPHSLRYLELIAHYTDGKPADTIKLNVPAMLPPYVIIPPPGAIKTDD
jgi:hypothetical protein